MDGSNDVVRATADGPTNGKDGAGETLGPVDGKESERYLLCPEEWDDPAGRNVICEYHSTGLEGVEGGAEVDLGPPAGPSGPTGIPRLRSEYHLEGAPYVEGGPAAGGASVAAPVRSARATGDGGGGDAGGGGGGDDDSEDEDHTAPSRVRSTGGHGRRGGRRPRLGRTARGPSQGRTLDLATAEMAAYAVSRALFGKGVRIPIRVENGIDMDLIVRGKEVVLNTNSIELVVPELTVWRITYAYRGRPVLELGRGVRDGLRLHWWGALVLLLAVWWGRRGRRRRAARAARDGRREEAMLASRS